MEIHETPKIEIHFVVEDQVILDEVKTTGKPAGRGRIAVFRLGEFSPEARAVIGAKVGADLLAEANEYTSRRIRLVVPAMRKDFYGRPDSLRAERRPLATATISLAEAEAFLLAEASELAAAEADLAQSQAEYDEAEASRKANVEAEAEAERKGREELEAARKAEKAAKEAERLAWIEAHGGDHLRRAVAAGYNCQRLYATERAAVEFPGWELDFKGEADWKARACPSEAGLDIEEEAKALAVAASVPWDGNNGVIWLTVPIGGLPKPEENDYYGDPEEYQPREAVVLRAFLGKYDLIRIV